MEVMENKRRGRPRKFGRSKETESTVASFPAAEDNAMPKAPEESLKDNAAEKERVKKAAAEIPEIFAAEDVEWVFDAYAGILSFVYSLVLKTDFDAIYEELSFTDEQKRNFSKPLSKILSKYAPAEWAGKTAEIQLITMMGIWTVASFKRAKNIAEAQAQKKRDTERTQPVQPIRRGEMHVPA